MDFDGKITKKELLEKIERRFQFTIILSVFIPSMWDTLRDAAPKAFSELFGNDIRFFGAVISYAFISYFMFEFFKKILRRIYLEIVDILLLLLSFSLIVVIGAVTVKGEQLAGLEHLVSQIALLCILVFVFSLSLTMIVGLFDTGFRWLKSKIKGN